MHSRDHITVLHVYDDSKTYLPLEQRKEYIYRTTESQLAARFSQSHYSLVWIPRDPSKTTRETLFEAAQRQGIDVMVVGFHGRRGPKGDTTIMGSAVDFHLHQGAFSLMIVKNQLHRSRIPYGSFNWIVLTDGSPQSEKSFQATLSMMRKERDNLYVLHGRESRADSFRHIYEPQFERLGVQGAYIEIDIRRKIFVEQLIEFLNSWEVRIDITVVGVYGVTATTSGLENVGSVATDIVKHVKGNVLVIK